MEKKEYTTQLMISFGEDGKTLLPVVTQDYRTKEVLILSFINKEAWEETLHSGYATGAAAGMSSGKRGLPRAIC